MSLNGWLTALSLAVSIGTPAAIFVARNWVLAWISKGIQYRFDVKIEELRTDLRKNEERFKSDLRDKEDEITTLRNMVVGGSASRQSLLDKRRFEAVEKVWTAVNDLAQLKSLSGMMAVLNFKAIAKEASDPRMQQFLAIIGTAAPDIKMFKNVARDERLYLPELAWAYFSAYITILYGSYARFSVLKSGLDEADKYLTVEGARKILKAALPHQSKFIDEHEFESYFYLLEEIEARLLIELRRVLDGKDIDAAMTARGKEIMDALKDVELEKAEHVAEGAKDKLAGALAAHG